MQKVAIRDFYSVCWPDAQIVELDQEKKNTIASVLDFSGADKMVQCKDGLIFLAQRFRRPHQSRYDDFTLRATRPSGEPTEWPKVQLALVRCGFLAGFYVYGLANERNEGFTRMRIIKFRELAQGIADGIFKLEERRNLDGTTWLALPFRAIPPSFFLLDWAEDKPQLKLEL